MRRLRVIARHWRPYRDYVRSHSHPWASTTSLTSVTLFFISVWLDDPAWVVYITAAAPIAFLITELILLAGDYRRSLSGAPQRHKVYTRNDIWKGRWPR